MADKRFLELVEEIKVLHAKKNAGYAGVGATDPWANFRMAQAFGITPFLGCLVRMSDKWIRISNLVKNPAADQVHESLKDTLFDLAIYALIAVCLLEEAQSSTVQQADLISRMSSKSELFIQKEQA